MENPNSTDSLRSLAQKWSLAGDDKLLTILENTHQKIISKCQDVNSKLEEMASALDDASINLQNVNNKFMALSNSQFIESRVYEYEITESSETQPAKELSQSSPVDELLIIKNSLAILEQTHEMAEILDDSDSDSDMEISVVLEPKDMYAHRPLPYVIGSQQWKNKWHVGLVVEESDSESDASKRHVGASDQFSDSESDSDDQLGHRDRRTDLTISETSPSVRPAAEVAAEVARRLAGPPRVPGPAPERSSVAPPAAADVYRPDRPDRPAASTIFPDEPPPLEAGGADDASAPSDEDDIFAEINRNKPYTQQRNNGRSNVTEDLFNFDKPYEIEQGDIFSDLAADHKTTMPVTQKSTLFEDESEPELFAESVKKAPAQSNKIEEPETSTKKPVGGISLFGTNKGTETIGAAILKRNRRKSSTSDDDSGSDKVLKNPEKPKPRPQILETPDTLITNKNIDEIDNNSNKKEKDIFDDLFSKSENKQKTTIKETPVKTSEKKDTKDIFSDNIFDDIDDIFTSNIKIPTKTSNEKSIFDDDDDLFAEVTKPKPVVNQAQTSKTDVKIEKKGLFDSDDDLFSDSKTDNNKVSKNIKNSATSKHNVERNTNIENVKSTEIIKEKKIFVDSPQTVDKTVVKSPVTTNDIFDSDSDDDIFANIKTSKTEEKLFISNKNERMPKNIEETFKPGRNQLIATEAKEKPGVFHSPSLFEEEEIDDLFISSNKSSKNAITELNIDTQTVTKDKPLTTNETAVHDTRRIESKTILDASNEEKIYEVVNKTEHRVAETLKPISKNVSDEEVAVSNTFKDDKGLISSQVMQQQNIVESTVIKNISTDVISTHKRELKSDIKDISKSQSVLPDVNDLGSTDTKKNELHVHTKEANKEQLVFDNNSKPVKDGNTLTSELKKINDTNIFDDILSEPPVFEKPSEPKKSKNVNALFDDDSDDESLFFKKNDVISDEKPEVFTTNANFDIFVNEPPALDIDFTIKSAENEDDYIFSSDRNNGTGSLTESAKSLELPKDADGINPHQIQLTSEKTILVANSEVLDNGTEVENKNTIFSQDLEKDIFNISTEDHTNVNSNITPVDKRVVDSDDELFRNLAKPASPKPSKTDISQSKESLKKNNDEDDLENIFKSDTESPKTETDTKKIGKINTSNFNINVNALIPGASPKKVSNEPKQDHKLSQEESLTKLLKVDETDNSQPKLRSHEKDNIEAVKSKESDSITIKSITFEEKPESDVLDNNASKQRARIQVKRRPSSRRARHEAVRKSAIDFGDDTDNSSSFDEPSKTKTISSEQLDTKKAIGIEKSKSEIIMKTDNNNVKNEKITEHSQKQIVSTDDTVKSDKNDYESNSNTESVPSNSKTIQNVSHKLHSNETNKNLQESKTTKVVYILNDEDIFNTDQKNIENYDIFRTKDEKANSDEDIFKTNPKLNETVTNSSVFAKDSKVQSDEDIFVNVGVKTLGKTYKDNTKKPLESIKIDFKTTSNENSIKNNKNINNKKVKTSMFDSSDEEIFKASKNTGNNTIFDSDSEEDLFGGKTKTEKDSKEQKNEEVRKKVEVKGSLFGDDEDDDDLFGVQKEKKATKPISKPSTSKEAPVLIAPKTVEPVFDDPLSMLDHED